MHKLELRVQPANPGGRHDPACLCFRCEHEVYAREAEQDIQEIETLRGLLHGLLTGDPEAQIEAGRYLTANGML